MTDLAIKKAAGKQSVLGINQRCLSVGLANSHTGHAYSKHSRVTADQIKQCKTLFSRTTSNANFVDTDRESCILVLFTRRLRSLALWLFGIPNLTAMASTLEAMASNLIAMASNLIAA